MYFEQKNAQEFEIPGGTKGYLYPAHPQGEQQIAMVEMDGVYPEKGYSINSVCTETIFLLEGQLTVEVDGQDYNLRPNDMIMILPGQKYKVTGKGKSIDLISPSWDKNQNKIIDQ